jgi:Beta-1,4-xylanase
MRLLYNDYGGDGDGAKADAIFKLVQRLREQGVPINGVGLQMHISVDNPPDPKAVSANMARCISLGSRFTSLKWT